MRIYKDYLIVKLRCSTDKVVSTFDLIDGVEVEKRERYIMQLKYPLTGDKEKDCVFSVLKKIKDERPDCEILSFSVVSDKYPVREVELK